MTRLTLSEACLMEASGELGAKAHAKLQAHIDKYPAALLEFEIARGNLEMLRTLPKVQLTQDESRQIGSNIKVGIQQKLWQAQHARKSAYRWKIAYRTLAGITGVAAAMVITAGVLWVEKQNNLRALRNAEQLVDGYLATGQTNDTDNQLGALSQNIEELLKNMASKTTPRGESEVLKFVGDESNSATADAGS